MISINEKWIYIKRLVKIETPWQQLIGERYRIGNHEEIDYWRVEKPHSVIIIPICDNQFIFPQPIYRPGAGKATLDFPGGRIINNMSIKQSAKTILYRELEINNTSKLEIFLKKINPKGLYINSSFSNQKIYGFSAILKPNKLFLNNQNILKYDISKKNYEKLLNRFECLQCRSLLIEYWNKEYL